MTSLVDKRTKPAGGLQRPRPKRGHLNLHGPILREIRRRERTSRIELAKGLSVAASTAGIHVDQLIEAGLVLESEAGSEGRAGRRPRHLTLRREGGCFVGLDFEASSVMASFLGFDGTELDNRHSALPSRADRKSTVEALKRAVRNCLPAGKAPLLAIGIGAPGPVDSRGGISLEYPLIAGWKNVPLVAALKEEFGCPVFLENNARATALAHHWIGEARQSDNFLSVTARSGIGIGYFLEGRLVRGAHSRSGEIGGLRVPPPRAGKAVTIESLASPEAMLRRARIASPQGAEIFDRFEKLTEAVRREARLATRAVNEGIDALAACLAELALVLDPECIVLDGPLTLLGDAALGRLKAGLSAHLPAWDPLPRIVFSRLGRHAGALGAASLAIDQWNPGPLTPLGKLPGLPNHQP